VVFRADIFPVLWRFLLPERKRQFQVFSELRSLNKIISDFTFDGKFQKNKEASG
jgi:hypothetical protein